MPTFCETKPLRRHRKRGPGCSCIRARTSPTARFIAATKAVLSSFRGCAGPSSGTTMREWRFPKEALAPLGNLAFLPQNDERRSR